MKINNQIKLEKFKLWLSSDNFTVMLYVLRAVWYIICFTFCAYYVVSNWGTLSKVTFYEGITLESLIFFILIGLTIMPFIKKIELIGFKVETNMDLPVNLDKNNVKSEVDTLQNLKSFEENIENLLKEEE